MKDNIKYVYVKNSMYLLDSNIELKKIDIVFFKKIIIEIIHDNRLDLLEKYHACLNRRDIDYVYASVLSGNIDTVKFLLSKSFRINKDTLFIASFLNSPKNNFNKHYQNIEILLNNHYRFTNSKRFWGIKYFQILI